VSRFTVMPFKGKFVWYSGGLARLPVRGVGGLFYTMVCSMYLHGSRLLGGG